MQKYVKKTRDVMQPTRSQNFYIFVFSLEMQADIPVSWPYLESSRDLLHILLASEVVILIFFLFIYFVTIFYS